MYIFAINLLLVVVFPKCYFYIRGQFFSQHCESDIFNQTKRVCLREIISLFFSYTLSASV